jgi:hypothetical protein
MSPGSRFLLSLSGAWLVILFSLATARASIVSHSVWNGYFLQGKISENWGYFLEQQLRLNDAPGLEPIRLRGNRWLVRPAVFWNVPSLKRLQLFFGAAHTPNLSPVRGEFRLWQQIQFSPPTSGVSLLQRLRLEQRHIEQTEGLSHRARLMLRAAHSISPESPWGLAVFDEVFWNLNTVNGGPAAGFDQNRFFAGPQYQIDQRTRLEVGYLQSWIARGAAQDSQVNHSAVIYLYSNLQTQESRSVPKP